MPYFRASALILVLSCISAQAQAAELYFREDWREIPAALPITPKHLGNSKLRMEVHGPGKLGIKKSHHDHIPNDPFYVWSGRCWMSWGLSLRKMGHLADLSEPDAKVRWRSRQSGGHALHLLVKLPGERWFISEQSDSGQDWHEHEFKVADLTWRHFSIIKALAEEKVDAPPLDQVEQIGFTDQKAGGGSKSSSRIDWIEVYGNSVNAPPTAPPAVKANRVPIALPDNVRAYGDLVYAKHGDRELTLDLYRPNDDTKLLPAVIFIHGGGWYKGDPSSYTAMAQQLAAQGYVTLNIFYRLSGEAPFPAAIEDCKAAVRWARANARTFRIDPDRIGSVGGSAGGHLSGLLGTSGYSRKLNQSDEPYASYSPAIQACVVMAGTMDFTTDEEIEKALSDPRRRLTTFMGGSCESAKQNYIDASPITHVSQRTPPMLFMDGEFDRPGERYPSIIKKLDTFAIHHESQVIKDGPHPFWTSHPFFNPALDILVKFFDRTLKEKKAS